MFKIIGAAAVIAGFALLGYGRAFVLARRCRNIEQFRRLVCELKSELLLKKTPLTEAFIEIGQRHSHKCFILCGEKIPELGAARAFSEAVEKTAAEYGFGENEKNAVLSLGDGLGKCEINDQISRIDHTISLIDSAAALAQRDKKEKSGIIMQGFVLAGVTIVLMLL